MALKLERQNDNVKKFLKLLLLENPEECDSFYFMLCGRGHIGGRQCRILLNDALVSENQKINQKLVWEHRGHTAKRLWTIVVTFTEKNWDKFQKTTCEKEVVFECLFKNSGRNPKFAPVFQFPTISSKINEYIIPKSEFRGESAFGFRSGAIKINKKEGRVVMLVRLQEMGYYQMCNYEIVS